MKARVVVAAATLLALMCSTGRPVHAQSYPDREVRLVLGFAEQGYPTIDDITVSGIYVPAAAPQPIVDKLRAALAEVKRSPEFRERLDKAGSLVYAGTHEEFAARIRKTADRYGVEFRKLGIELQ
jgi:tripartite-type tricarboxylate transporter receptor subunit TctC